MKSALIFKKDRLAGELIEDEKGYIFKYFEEYIQSPNPQGVSKTLPIRKEPYFSKQLFPFFDGLIPEGWLLQIAIETQNLNPRNRMDLLLALCRDCIGDVSIQKSMP